MALALGSNIIAEGDPLKMGDTQIEKIMLDGNLVWQNTLPDRKPTTPSNFAASEGEPNQITFTWDLPSDEGKPICTYLVRNSTFQVIIAAPEGATSIVFGDAGALSDTFHVIAINAIGESGVSNQDTGSSFGQISPLIISAAATYTAGQDFPADWDITVCMCGGGGSGASTTGNAGTSGGGSQGVIESQILNIPDGTPVPCTIGNGGGYVSDGYNAGITGGQSTFGTYLTALGGVGGSAVSSPDCDGPYNGHGGAFVSPCDGVTYNDGVDNGRSCGNYYALGGQAGAFGSGGRGWDYDPAGSGGIGAGGGGVSDSQSGGEPSGPGGRGQIMVSW